MSNTATHIDWQQAEKKNKRKGFITSLIIHLLLLILFFMVGLYHKDPPDPEEGILINFGTVDAAAGDVQPTAKEPDPVVAEEEITEEQPLEEVVEEIPPETVEETQPEITEPPVEEIETQDMEEAPAIPETEEKKEEPVDEPEEEKPVEKEEPVEQPKEEKPVEKEEPAEKPKEEPVEKPKEEVKEKPAEPKEDPKPTVDERALFDGSPAESDQKGNDGNQTGPGDQGAENGDPNATNRDGDKSYGLGDEGVGYNLEGRSLLGIPPVEDKSQETGIVVVRIKVNRNGDVISASYTSKGSTTTDEYLIKQAEEAARKAKFNPDSKALEEQFGTITFTFKLR